MFSTDGSNSQITLLPASKETYFGLSVEIDQNTSVDASYCYGIIGAPKYCSPDLPSSTTGSVYIVKIERSDPPTWSLLFDIIS